uniref:Uncharacterized protein n=1 Tax=Romanomermis culicivorax TaxID=13658 RepID=A0A915HL68_ROMCU
MQTVQVFKMRFNAPPMPLNDGRRAALPALDEPPLLWNRQGKCPTANDDRILSYQLLGLA